MRKTKAKNKPQKIVLSIPTIRINPTHDLKPATCKLDAASARNADFLPLRETLIAHNMRHALNDLHHRPPRVTMTKNHIGREHTHDRCRVFDGFEVCPVFHRRCPFCMRSKAVPIHHTPVNADAHSAKPRATSRPNSVERMKNSAGDNSNPPTINNRHSFIRHPSPQHDA